MIQRVVACFILVYALAAAGPADASIQSAMVKIFTVENGPSYANPWNSNGPRAFTGSGAVIGGNRIITNAHVVSNSTFIQVRAHGRAERCEARVAAISHQADLAILEVDAPGFFESIKPIDIGSLPEIRQPIVVYGYPTGGDTLSMTTGVVSRIEHQHYSHSKLKLLSIQVDAAVNSGNSGGPALSEDGRIVGISMQSRFDADNIAYLIPPPVIRQFLTDLDDGTLSGIPALGIATQAMENPSLRQSKQMKADVTGCLVTHVVPDTSADGLLQPGDVLLKIGKYDVADDQTIEFRSQERTDFQYCVQRLQLDDAVDVQILRNGRRRNVRIPLHSRLGDERIVPLQYVRNPTYYIYGGIVFSPLTVNYLQLWGGQWWSSAPASLTVHLYRNRRSAAGEQVVIVSRVLPDAVNAGYHEISNQVLLTINGRQVRNMAELIERIENGTAPFIELTLDNGTRIVLNRADCLATNDSILRKYQIPQDRFLAPGAGTMIARTNP